MTGIVLTGWHDNKSVAGRTMVLARCCDNESAVGRMAVLASWRNDKLVAGRMMVLARWRNDKSAAEEVGGACLLARRRDGSGAERCSPAGATTSRRRVG